MKWLIELITNLIRNRFTGSLKVNFFKGGISNVNKEESIRPPEEETEE